MKQQQDLRVDTSSNSHSPLSIESFHRAWPRVDANHQRAWEQNPQEQQDSTNDVSGKNRMIQRSFAFDEWDEEAMQHNSNQSPNSNGTPNPLYTMDELEEELHRTILRTFAFDEWDDETLAGDDEPGQCVTPTSAPFVPIQNVAGNHNNTAPSPQNTPSALRFGGIAQTKFDLDAKPVTPSPPRKVQRPVPLYSQQSTPTLFDVNASKQAAENSCKNLERVLRDSFVPSFPLRCESIPRQASAFSIPNRQDSPQVVEKEDGNTDNDWEQEQQQQQTHWFDMYGSGTTLFEDDDYIFESPTSSASEEEEDFMFSLSGIPRLVVCYKNSE